MGLMTIVFALLVFISFMDVARVSNVTKFIVFVAIGALLVFLASFRFGDRDYLNYLDIYNGVNALFESRTVETVHGEPGYLLLNRICKTLGIGSIGVFFIMALSSVTLSLAYFRKHTDFFLIALLIYFSHVFLLRDMLQIRSGLAASISLYSLCYIQQRKLLPFLLIILLASMFHAGAAILFLVYFLFPYLRDNTKRQYFLVGLGFLLGIVLSASLLEYVFIEVIYVPGVSLYTGDEEYFKSLGLLNPVLLKSASLVILLIYFKDKIQRNVVLFEVFLVSLITSVFWLATFNNFSIFGARLATYLSNVEHLLIPSLFYTNIRKIYLWIIIVCYCAYMFSAKFEAFKDLSFYFLN
ncbi:MAG: EpsG family protein [Pedobacter sp.]|nr:MAG: EpsG family protein [Pedobacter sp.]